VSEELKFEYHYVMDVTMICIERVDLQLRSEAFNLINRANYSNPGSTVASASTFGAIPAAGATRVLQFALRVQFQSR
jgi:hypothetical protein